MLSVALEGDEWIFNVIHECLGPGVERLKNPGFGKSSSNGKDSRWNRKHGVPEYTRKGRYY